MKKLPRIVLAKPVIHGVLKIVWNDGYEGVVDLRPTIARGKIFSYLQKPKNFEKLRVSDYGHSVGWVSAVPGTSNDKSQRRRVTHHSKPVPGTVGYAARTVPAERSYREAPLTHPTEWTNENGEDIDFGTDTLRRKAENQARLNEVASVLQY
jgi:hypothetical protein